MTLDYSPHSIKTTAPPAEFPKWQEPHTIISDYQRGVNDGLNLARMDRQAERLERIATVCLPSASAFTANCGRPVLSVEEKAAALSAGAVLLAKALIAALDKEQ